MFVPWSRNIYFLPYSVIAYLGTDRSCPKHCPSVTPIYVHGITPYLNGSGKGQSTSAAATIACRGGPASELDKFVEAGMKGGVFGQLFACLFCAYHYAEGVI